MTILKDNRGMEVGGKIHTCTSWKNKRGMGLPYTTSDTVFRKLAEELYEMTNTQMHMVAGNINRGMELPDIASDNV